MKAVITIKLKDGVLDPQGKAIASALNGLGFDEVQEARQGKVIELDFGRESGKDRVTQMCEKLLANPVIESYEIDLEDAS